MPSTHYQVSFTSKQALGLFVFLLFALVGAYFLGLMTGLPEKAPDQAAPTEAGKTDSAAQESFPTPVLGLQPGAKPPERESGLARGQAQGAPAPETTARASIVLFEDRADGESSEPPQREVKSSASPRTERVESPGPASAAGFWVQVVSLTSEREARALGARLAVRGYKAVVLSGSTPAKGTVYRVRVGPYETRGEAARAATRLSVEEKAETWVVPAGE